MRSAYFVAVAFSVVAAAAGLVALRLSALAYSNSRRALRSVTPPPRSQANPVLRLGVISGHVERSVAADTREYAIAIEVGNATLRPVTISSIALRVTYRTRANFLGAVDLVADPESKLAARATPLLKLPVELGAGGNDSGFVFFSTANIIPRHCRVQDYALVAYTSDGRRVVSPASMDGLLVFDTDGKGPATWGWD